MCKWLYAMKKIEYYLHRFYESVKILLWIIKIYLINIYYWSIV